MTSYAALRGLTILATTDEGCKLNMTNLGTFAENFIELMKKAERQVNISALEATLAYLERYPQQFTQQYGNLQGELAKIIKDTDVYQSTLAIICAQIIMGLNG